MNVTISLKLPFINR